jgi:hypothetical protein
MNALRSSIQGGAGLWIVLAVLVVTGWPALVLGDRELMISFTDDTFYYLVVARHVALGHGFTFDGLHPTNGFQPLWLFMLVPIFRLVPGDFAPLRILLALQSVLFAGGSLLLWRILRSRLPPAAAAAVPLLMIGLPGASGLWYGMESGVFFFVLILSWAAWLRIAARAAASPGEWALLGGCCALLFLARVEGGAALAVVLLLGSARLRAAPRPAAALAALVAPAAVIWGGYLAWNALGFGTWLPISGAVKLHWVSRLDPSQRLMSIVDVPWFGRFLLPHLFKGPVPLSAIAACGAIFFGAVGAAFLHRRAVARALREANASYVAITCAIIFLFDQGVVGAYLGEWALVPLFLLTSIAIGLAAGRARRAGAVVLVIACLLCAARVPAHARNAERWDGTFLGQGLALAGWIRDHAPPEARIGALYAGVLGYFSERIVINLDGLVNSVEYYERVLVGDGWEGYLREERIDHVAHVGCIGDESVTLWLEYFGRETRSIDRYSLRHFVRDPDRPGDCGLLLLEIPGAADGIGRDAREGEARSSAR